MRITNYKESVWKKVKDKFSGNQLVPYREKIDVSRKDCTYKFVRMGMIVEISNVVTEEMYGADAIMKAGVLHAMFPR